MTIGVVIFVLFTFMGVASANGRPDAALKVLGYLLAFTAITVLLILGAVVGYTYLIHHLWTM